MSSRQLSDNDLLDELERLNNNKQSVVNIFWLRDMLRRIRQYERAFNNDWESLSWKRGCVTEWVKQHKNRQSQSHSSTFNRTIMNNVDGDDLNERLAELIALICIANKIATGICLFISPLAEK